jgi:hypothetical protein
MSQRARFRGANPTFARGELIGALVSGLPRGHARPSVLKIS